MTSWGGDGREHVRPQGLWNPKPELSGTPSQSLIHLRQASPLWKLSWHICTAGSSLVPPLLRGLTPTSSLAHASATPAPHPQTQLPQQSGFLAISEGWNSTWSVCLTTHTFIR